MVDGVVEQDQHDLDEARTIDLGQRRAGRVGQQRHVVLGGEGARAADRVAHQLRDVDGGPLEDEPGRVEGRQAEEVVHERGEAVGLADDVGQERLALLADEGLPIQDLGVGPDQRGRCPQLVRCIGDEPALGLERAPDRDERSAGDDERHEGGPDEPGQGHRGDRCDEARRLAVVQAEDEAALDVADDVAVVEHGHGQEPDRQPVGDHGPEVLAGRRQRDRRGQADQPDPRRVRHDRSVPVEHEEERVGRGRQALVRFSLSLGRGISPSSAVTAAATDERSAWSTSASSAWRPTMAVAAPIPTTSRKSRASVVANDRRLVDAMSRSVGLATAQLPERSV